MLILKRLKIFYKLILIAFVFLSFFCVFLFLLLYYFPLQTSIETAQSKKFPYLFAPWPTKVTEEQAQEMKKWKKYNKAEQKRRLEKQHQQMTMLNSPIYNLFLDDDPSFSSPNLVSVYGKTNFIWPAIPASKVFRNHTDQNVKRRSSYLLFPHSGWIQTLNGVYLSSGEEIKFDVPVSKERRYLNFNVFPVSEGVLQVFLGQHGWSHVFHEEDIQSRSSFSIPIYDSTASNIKIWSSSFNGYLSDVVVNHVLSNAREPIHVSDSSMFWSIDKKSNQTLENLSEEKNPQISVSEKFSTALGYNIVLLQINDLDHRIFDNPKVLSKLAPHLSEMMKNSIHFKNIFIPENSFDSFRKFAFAGSEIVTQKNHMPIVKNTIDQNKEKNTYFRFQKYGYKTLAISAPQVFFFSKDFSKYNKEFDFYGRWLNQSDWDFEKENVEIDEKSQATSGLQAIFKQQEKQIPLPLVSKDYLHLSKILSESSKNLDQIPEWNANEYLFVNPQREYVPMVLESFKRWTLDNSRERFFSHIFLNSKSFGDRPFLKDVGKSFFSDGLASVFNPFYLNNMAYVSLLDRAFAQLWDTIQGRHLENRTILFVLFQNQHQTHAQGMFHIPGLQPKIHSLEREVSQNDILATLLSTVGIPSGDNVENLNGYNLGSMQEVTPDEGAAKAFASDSLTEKTQNHYRKYTMLVRSGKGNCRSFEWKAEGAPFFAVQADYPIYRVKDDHSLEIFPCSGQNRVVKISWYQQKGLDLDQKPLELTQALGGHFSFLKNLENLPEFYFGEKMISMQHAVFSFDRLDDQNVEKIFFVETGHLDEVIKSASASFSEESKKSRIALFISNI